MCRLRVGSLRIVCPDPVKPTICTISYYLLEAICNSLPRPCTPSGVLNILSFFAVLPNLPLDAKSCHLFLPASSSLFALIFLGTFAGLTGPSLTLLGSLLVCCASSGSISAAADIMLVFTGGGGNDETTGVPSALRLLGFVMGLMSLARNVSVVS